MTVLSPDDSCLQGTASRNPADPERGQALTDPRLVSRLSWPWPTGRSETACPLWGSFSVPYYECTVQRGLCHAEQSYQYYSSGSCELLATAGPAARARLHRREGSSGRQPGGGASEGMTWILPQALHPFPLGRPSGECTQDGKGVRRDKRPQSREFLGSALFILLPMAPAEQNTQSQPRIRVAQGWLGPSWPLRRSRTSPGSRLLLVLRNQQVHSGL